MNHATVFPWIKSFTWTHHTCTRSLSKREAIEGLIQQRSMLPFDGTESSQRSSKGSENSIFQFNRVFGGVLLRYFLRFHSTPQDPTRYQSENGDSRYLLDDCISSYTPTLTSLIASRTSFRAGTRNLLFGGDTTLDSATKEYFAIRKRLGIEKRLVDNKASGPLVVAPGIQL